MKDFQRLQDYVFGIMEDKLPSYLSYHSIDHTKHVMDRSEFIAKKEGKTEEEIYLLRTAALFHDLGFIEKYKDHEEKGCEYVKEELPKRGYSEEEIDKICGMIMATKIPQSPHTDLEMIIADADLEYLGTENFKEIGNLLYEELKHFNAELTVDEWNEIQVKFLKAHRYHTEYCKQYREWKKNENMNSLI